MKLPEWANWVARDNSGGLWAYENEPYKTGGYWRPPGGKSYSLTEYGMFPEVSWDDTEPTPLYFILPAESEENSNPFTAVTQEMFDTYLTKNAMYGDSFAKLLAEVGPIAGAGQIFHKTNRLVSLAKGTQNDAESTRDTLLDLANYCVMQVMWMDKQDEELKELQQDTVERVRSNDWGEVLPLDDNYHPMPLL